jgi:ABC-type transporter Mla subunit MlaD
MVNKMIPDSVVVDLQRRTERMDVMLDKLDASIEKLTEVSQNVSKLLAVHEEKLGQQEKINNNFSVLMEQRRNETDKKLEDIWDELKDIRNEQRSQHNSINDKLSKFERFVWMVGGGGVVIGFLLSYGPTILKLIK